MVSVVQTTFAKLCLTAATLTHRGYNQAIMEIVDNIDKNSKCDREKARKIQLFQSQIHKALKSGSMSLYKLTTKQDWINYLI